MKIDKFRLIFLIFLGCLKSQSHASQPMEIDYPASFNVKFRSIWGGRDDVDLYEGITYEELEKSLRGLRLSIPPDVNVCLHNPNKRGEIGELVNITRHPDRKFSSEDIGDSSYIIHVFACNKDYK